MCKHVSDEKIESLALGRLRTHDSIRVQQHLYKCSGCLSRLVQITFNLDLNGFVLTELSTPDKRKPLYMAHETADGWIYSKCERQGRKWIARQWGDQVEGGKECSTMREANRVLVQAFREMFPEHRCTDRCKLTA